MNTLSDYDKYQIVNKFSSSDINQTISYSNDSYITSIIINHELSLHEAYVDLCKKLVKVKKLNKKLFNKLIIVENKKNNSGETLKLLEVQISRSLTKIKAFEKELIVCKQT